MSEQKVDEGQPEMSREEFKQALREYGEAFVEDIGGPEKLREFLFPKVDMLGRAGMDIPVQYAKRGMAKHKERLAKRYVAAPSVASASLLMLREATGGEFRAPSTREARAVLRKMAHEKRKAGK